MLFLGTYTPRLDDKGRMILPAKFRDRLAGGLVITRGQEHCLYVFTQADFERLVQQWQDSPTSSKTVRDYQRFFLSGASDVIIGSTLNCNVSSDSTASSATTVTAIVCAAVLESLKNTGVKTLT